MNNFRTFLEKRKGNPMRGESRRGKNGNPPKNFKNSSLSRIFGCMSRKKWKFPIFSNFSPLAPKWCSDSTPGLNNWISWMNSLRVCYVNFYHIFFYKLKKQIGVQNLKFWQYCARYCWTVSFIFMLSWPGWLRIKG